MDFEKLAREEVLKVRPYIPGKPVEELQRERGLSEIIKLASNENPRGPAPAVIEVLERDIRALNRYPDDSAFYLYRALAKHLQVSERRILVGNGSVEILYFLADIFVKPGENLVYATPSFVIYDIVATLSLGEGRPVPCDGDFRHDLDAMLARVDDRTKLVFVCNPNNPTGTYVTEAELRRFLDAVPPEVLVVVDEAYYEYVDAPDYPQTLEWLERYPNLVVLRTFSKIHSLAGLRIGYSISHPELVGLLQRVRPPFNVNSLSQAAALASLGETERVRRIAAENRLGITFLSERLATLGCRVLPSQTNFVMVFLPIDAAAAYDKLLDRGVIVRPMPSFGTDINAVRISVGLEEENQRAVAALEELLGRKTVS
ncbi:MAG: histidinol-phosphate transaminase [Candidatus Krumholzibacteriota bacterium]|nr:histidinol-phosphate transaminase [Candidatus Krumholzibacteriota bacterium]